MAKKHKKGNGKGKKKFVYKKEPKVHCSNCPAFVNEADTEFVNIEEDMQGVDVLTFICPNCKTEQKSRIFL